MACFVSCRNAARPRVPRVRAKYMGGAFALRRRDSRVRAPRHCCALLGTCGGRCESPFDLLRAFSRTTLPSALAQASELLGTQPLGLGRP